MELDPHAWRDDIETYPLPMRTSLELRRQQAMEKAVIILAIARPILRQEARDELLDELIAEAYEDGWDIPSKVVSDWLYTLKEADHE